MPRLLWAYAWNGEDGLSRIAERLHREAHAQPEEKFDKREVLYLPQSPFPPTLWQPTCGRCRFWQEGGPGSPGGCHLVGRPGDPFGGEAIHPRGVCGLWMPPAGEPAFAWIRDRLDPSGATSIRGEYRSDTTGAGVTPDAEPATPIPVTEGDDDGER